MGSSRDPQRPGGKTYNKSYYCGDLSAVPIKDNKMKGKLVVHMTPDAWVPGDHKPYFIEMDVDLSVVENKMIQGTYKVTAVSSKDGGAEALKTGSGSAIGALKESKTTVIPSKTTFTLNLQGALVGGRPDYGERCLVPRLGFEDGKLCVVEYGRLSQKDEVYGLQVAENQSPDARPFWAPVNGFVPVKPGEHPRLLFRKSDVAALRKKSETPEGKAIIARLRLLLNGKDGETMPTAHSASTKAYERKGVKDDEGDVLKKGDIGAYTMSHAAGYGLLYQLTGDKKYAELGKQCFEKVFVTGK